MARVIDGADRAQRRWSVLGYPIAVIYKYFDDQGNYLASIITYYAFIAIFPLLLLGSSILGFILQGNQELQQDLIDSALAQFPIIGDQLGRPEGLTGSDIGDRDRWPGRPLRCARSRSGAAERAQRRLVGPAQQPTEPDPAPAQEPASCW